ncbi:MAG: porin family protein [Rhizobiales bacterium]|nr:porin family protein [Hyphomicrobiales bacterium]
MKKLAAHVAAISLLFAGSAVAADMRMPVKAPPLAPAPVLYNWTGCYVGAGGGYGMYDQESRFVDINGVASLSNDNGGRGWFGTVQVGCDYQIGSNIVIGAFADYDFSGIKGDMSVPVFGWVGEEKLKNSWAAGGRIGWLPFQFQNRLLVFVSGGYTQARFGRVDFFEAADGSPAGFNLAKNKYEGWFIGTGYEYGLGFLPGLFWKTEYRFADYGEEHVPVLRSDSLQIGTLESHKYVHTVRSELVWRFNWGGGYGAPVAARY